MDLIVKKEVPDTEKNPLGMEEEAYTATGIWNKERGPQPAQK